jgi:parallel beta-helix repeat protein
MSEQGIYVSKDSSPQITRNIINNDNFGINLEYGYYTQNNPILSGNAYSENPEGDINIYGNISAPVTWMDSGVYRIDSLEVNEGASLRIQPGTVVAINYRTPVKVRGMLEATEVTFTWADGVNQWGGIKFYETSLNSRLENCTIEHSYDYTQYVVTGGVVLIEGSSPVITGCTINNCVAETGINVQETAFPFISNNTISGMSEQGIYVDKDAAPIVSYNSIFDNTNGISVDFNNHGLYDYNNIYDNLSYGLYYKGGLVISAKFSYWGDDSGPYDPSDDRLSGGWYNPAGKGDKVSDKVAYQPWSVNTQNPCAGDYDRDGDVDGSDLMRLVEGEIVSSVL